MGQPALPCGFYLLSLWASEGDLSRMVEAVRGPAIPQNEDLVPLLLGVRTVLGTLVAQGHTLLQDSLHPMTYWNWRGIKDLAFLEPL
jgi:hypothetical protein